MESGEFESIARTFEGVNLSTSSIFLFFFFVRLAVDKICIL